MKLERVPDGTYVLGLTGAELAVVKNCMNEALEALGQEEFKIRVGVAYADAEAMLRQLGSEWKRLK